MKLEYAGVSKENLKSGISLTITNSTRQKNINNIFKKKYSNMLDWLDLPDTKKSELDSIVEYGKFINKKFKKS